MPLNVDLEAFASTSNAQSLVNNPKAHNIPRYVLIKSEDIQRNTQLSNITLLPQRLHEEVQVTKTNDEETSLSYSKKFYEKTKKEYEETLKQITSLKTANTFLSNQVQTLTKKVKTSTNKLESLNKCFEEKQISHLNNLKMQEMLEQCFTKNQVNLILNKKKLVTWTTEEISQAITIRHFSKRCYIYLRQRLNFPLPAISTLQRWASKIVMNQGILPDVLRFMDIASTNLTDLDKLVVLQFSYMQVNIGD